MPDDDYELLKKLREFFLASKNLPVEKTQPDWNAPFTKDLPPVARPEESAKFLSDPPITGSPEFVKFATKLLDTSYSAKRNVSRVNIGPTAGSIYYGVREADNPDIYPIIKGKGQLGGVYEGKGDKAIGLNPEYPNSLNRENLAHEVAHAVGYGDKPGEMGQAKTAYDVTPIFMENAMNDLIRKLKSPDYEAVGTGYQLKKKKYLVPKEKK